MSLADRLESARPPQRGMPCPVATILGLLPPRDADALRRVIDAEKGDPDRLGAQQIATMLGEPDEGEEPHEIHYAAIEKHRRRACRCYRGTNR